MKLLLFVGLVALSNARSFGGGNPIRPFSEWPDEPYNVPINGPFRRPYSVEYLSNPLQSRTVSSEESSQEESNEESEESIEELARSLGGGYPASPLSDWTDNGPIKRPFRRPYMVEYPSNPLQSRTGSSEESSQEASNEESEESIEELARSLGGSNPARPFSHWTDKPYRRPYSGVEYPPNPMQSRTGSSEESSQESSEESIEEIVSGSDVKNLVEKVEGQISNIAETAVKEGKERVQKIAKIALAMMASKLAEEGCSREEITRHIQQTVEAMNSGSYPPKEISGRWFIRNPIRTVGDIIDRINRW